MNTSNKTSDKKEIFIILRSIEGTEKRIGPFSTTQAAAQWSYRINPDSFMNSSEWESIQPEGQSK